MKIKRFLKTASKNSQEYKEVAMMMIDTHALVKEIVALGVDEKKAEFAINNFVSQEQLEQSVVKPSEFREAMALLRNDIANLDRKIGEVKSELKSDISELRNELKSDIIEVRNELKVSIAEVRTEIARTKSDILLWAITPLSLGIIGTVIAIFLK